MPENPDDMLLRVLRDPLLWEPPVLVSRKEIAAIFAAVDEENAAAEELCESLLAAPPAQWRKRFFGTPEARTLGMVRQLLKRMPALVERRPSEALQVTVLAVVIADALSPHRYPLDHVLLVYAEALRDHAFVLSCLGRHADAMETITWAGRVLAQVPDAQREMLLDSAERTRIVHAQITEAARSYERSSVNRALEMRRGTENRVQEGGGKPRLW